jgi:ribosome biogenesis protein YTM1
MEVDQSDVAQVQVRFKTRLERHRVTEKPFAVPVSLNRRGLSQVINHLLEYTASPVPFDFLIENEFLRTNLEKYIKDHNRSMEEVITIEYVELFDEPTPSSAATHSDWIAAIDNRLYELRQSLKSSGGEINIIPYGAYDTQVCCYDEALLKANPDAIAIWNIGAHSQPVLGVSSYFRGGSSFDLASCSQDGSVSVWHVEAVKRNTKQTFSLVGHDGAVEHVEFDPTGKLLATSSWDGDLKIWDLSDAEAAKGASEERKTKKSKNKETNGSDSADKSVISEIEARSTFVGHMQCVSTLQWLNPDQIVSGSWDHSLRFWDVESGVCTSHLDGNKVILSLDASEHNGLIATGHCDKSVRTWDPRVSVATTSLSTSYTSHTGWVSSVQWHPTNANLLISGSFDSNIKIWDLRSTTPLHTLASQHKDKVTTLAWIDDQHFASGGADQYIRSYKFPLGSSTSDKL